ALGNFSAVCEQLRSEARPVDILCAGEGGNVSLEDTLLAGALVEALSETGEGALDDGARIAWGAFEHHGRELEDAPALWAGGVRLRSLGYDEDIAAAARVDAFALAPELRRLPDRVEIGAVGISRRWWRRGRSTPPG